MNRSSLYAILAIVCVFLSVADAFLLPAGLGRLRNSGNDATPLGGAKEKRLIETGLNEREWLTEEEIFAKIRRRERFMDVTESPELLGEVLPETLASDVPIPEHLTQQKVVKPMFESIDTESMKAFLRRFTAFHTRFYKSETGAEASRSLLAELQAIADARVNTEEVEVTVAPFRHTWGQASIIVTITGKGNQTAKAGPQKPILPEKTDAVIISSHLDSVNGWNPWFGRAPGADDNGSGTATAREAFRVLMQSGWVPSYPVQFHFNSAEEGGLLGSQAIAAEYKRTGKKVLGFLQMDINGYVGEKGDGRREVIGVGTDFVDDALSDFLRKLVEEYNQIKWISTKCGYGCSDHASWFKLGYRTAFPFEAPFEEHSPYIHTSDDTIEHLSFGHLKRFVELVLAFAVELSMA